MMLTVKELQDAESTPSPEGALEVRSIHSLTKKEQEQVLHLLHVQAPAILSKLQTSQEAAQASCSLLIAQSYWYDGRLIAAVLVVADHDTLGTLQIGIALEDWNYFHHIEVALAKALHTRFHCTTLTISPLKQEYSQQAYLLQAGYRLHSEQKTGASITYSRRIGRLPLSSVKTVSLREIYEQSPQFARILLHGCYKLYSESFPDPEEQETEALHWESLTRSEPHWDILAVYKNGKLIGARHFALFTTDHPEVQSFAVGEYLYVDRSVRRQGYGRTLIVETERFISGWNIRVILSEQKDPYVMDGEQLATDEASGISTIGRLKFWHTMGYECCDALYFSPPVEQGKKPSLYYRLAIKRLDRSFPNTISKSAYLTMIKMYHESWVESWDQDPLTKHFMNILAQQDSNQISFIQLLKERSCKKETMLLRSLPH